MDHSPYYIHYNRINTTLPSFFSPTEYGGPTTGQLQSLTPTRDDLHTTKERKTGGSSHYAEWHIFKSGTHTSTLLRSVRPPPTKQSQRLSTTHDTQLRGDFPSHNGDPFKRAGGTQHEATESTLPGGLPTPYYLSTQQFSARQPSFLLPLLEFSISDVQTSATISDYLTQGPNFHRRVPFSTTARPNGYTVVEVGRFVGRIKDCGGDFLMRRRVYSHQ